MTDVLKISIALTSKQITVLRAAIKTGGYATISEVVREAIRVWKENNETKRAKKKAKTKAKPKSKPRRRHVARKKTRSKKKI